MITFLLIAIIISLLYVYIHLTERSRQIDRMFPGPFRTPIIGTLLLEVLLTKSKNRKGLAQTYDYQPYRLWFLNKPYIMISDYKTAKIILSHLKFIDKAECYDAFTPLLGRNHYLGTGEVRMKYRKVTNIAFNYNALNHYVKIFNKNCDTMCQMWQKHSGKEAINIEKLIPMYVMDNLIETLMGEKCNWLTNPNPPLIKAIHDLSKIFRWRLIMRILRVDWIFNLTPLSRIQKKAIEIGHEYSKKMLQSKKKSILRQQKLNESNPIENQESPIQDPLTQFITTNEFTDEEIQMEIVSSIFGGYETVTATICFALHSLAKHQDIQEKVYEEIKTVIEESDTWPNMNDLNKMVYTEQVLCETLRCYTPFMAIGRLIKEDLQLNEHQFIPKNTNVFIRLSGINKDPLKWSNPQVFDPDRFSQENNQGRDPYAFVPFSAGPRKCSGYKFAIIEMKIAVAKVIQRFKLNLSDKPEDEVRPVRNMGLTISSSTGFKIKLESRDEIKLS